MCRLAIKAGGTIAAMLQGVARYRPPPGRIVLADACSDIAFVGGRLFFSGPLTVARATPHGGQDVLLLRLGIPIVRELLGVPLAELRDRVVPLDEINRSLTRTLTRRIETNSIESFVELRSTARADLRFFTAARALAAGGSVRATAEGVALSERQLERLWQDRVGVGPKTFTRIVRFRRAVIAASQGKPLADVAMAHGFADQAHLTREVVAFTGRPPRVLLPQLAHVASVQDIDSWSDVGCE
jgi:AraC-like DNA-binding protein